jgi:hypothetical protein
MTSTQITGVALLVATVAASLIIANMRERDCDKLIIRWAHGSRSLHFGWPLVSFRQREKITTQLSVQSVNQDFDGSEQVSGPQRTPTNAKRWLALDEPITRVHAGAMVVNTLVQLAIVIATAVVGYRNRAHLGRVSLSALLLWVTWVPLLLGSQVDVRPWQDAFWTGRPLRSLDWVDVVQSCILAIGCTCLVQGLVIICRRTTRSLTFGAADRPAGDFKPRRSADGG